MDIKNQGYRDIIVATADINFPKGATIPEDPKFHICPDKVVDVKDSLAMELIRLYPKDIVKWGR
jgi:hypothetical protein